MTNKIHLKTKFHQPESCSKCVYLGSEKFKSKENPFYDGMYDYYFCRGFDKTLIARYEEDGGYYSGIVFAFLDEPNEPIRQAAKLALCYPEIVEMIDEEIKHYPDNYKNFIELKKEILQG